MTPEEYPRIGGKLLASFNTAFNKIEARENFLLLARRFPPKEREVKYKEIAGVKHKRLIAKGRLVAAQVLFGLAYAFMYVQPVIDILGLLIRELAQALPSVGGYKGEELGLVLAAICLVAGIYYLIKFAMSLGQKLVIYRSGKKPISIPMRITGDSLQLLAKINEKAKEAGGITKAEAEVIIGEQLKGLLDQRMQMQNRMIESLRAEVRAAKASGDTEAVKQKIQESIQKLESQDELIDRELKKTGLNKEEIFKKYRIKPPKEEFIDSVLASEGLEDLMK